MIWKVAGFLTAAAVAVWIAASYEKKYLVQWAKEDY